MNNFIKNNALLVIGVVIPLVLMGMFVIAKSLPGMMVDPPQYDFIYSDQKYDDRSKVKFNVVNGRLQAKAYAYPSNSYPNTPKLYYFDAKAKTSKEIEFEIPSDDDVDFGEPPEGGWNYSNVTKHTVSLGEITIPEVENLKLNTKQTSPDGYKLRDKNNYSSNPFNWFVGRRNRGCYIEKEGIKVRVPVDIYSCYNVKFLGWVIPDSVDDNHSPLKGE